LYRGEAQCRAVEWTTAGDASGRFTYRKGNVEVYSELSN